MFRGLEDEERGFLLRFDLFLPHPEFVWFSLIPIVTSDVTHVSKIMSNDGFGNYLRGLNK